MNMNKYIVLFLVIGYTLPATSFGQSDQSQHNQILVELDSIDNKTSQEMKRIKNELEGMQNRLSEFSQSVNEVRASKENIESRYQEILKINASFEKLNQDVIKNSERYVALNTISANIEKDIIRIEGNVDSSQSIVRWVTMIVTLVVILIGMFFSKLFLDLYSNYRVLASKEKTSSSDPSTDDASADS